MPLPFVAALLLAGAAAAPPSSEDCLACHSDPALVDARGRRVHVEATALAGSAHDGLDCASCHEGIGEAPHPSPAPPVACASCHDDAARAQAASAHAPGAPDRPSCTSCHGHGHRIRPAADPSSPVGKDNVARTCASCHADPGFLARHRLPLARPVESFERSVHARARRAGDGSAATCSDCHGTHAIQRASDPQAGVSRERVPETCGTCHAEVARAYAGSVHGQAMARGARDAPVCTDCHGEHAILAPGEPDSLVNPARVSSATCGRCHGDERLTQKYNLPREQVPAFEDSYHGLAGRAGSQSVANCASCHGVHNILPSSDARSTVHPSNLGETCGACHPGAGRRFAIGPVHVVRGAASEHVAVRLARRAYVVVILLTIGFMLLHNGLDFARKLRRSEAHGPGSGEVPRMNRAFRLEHGAVVLSFVALVVTGFALKFPDAWWAAPLVAWEGRFAFRGLVHRGAGVLLMGALVAHVVHLAVSRRDRRILRDLLPGRQDLRDLAQMFRHNLGRGERPRFGHFSYAEKMEYWAFLWGTAVMAATGVLLWFNDLTLRFLPGWAADLATVVHYYEAILASLSILVWHLYMVVFDPDVYPVDRAFWTGRTSADHFRRTRAVAPKEETR